MHIFEEGQSIWSKRRQGFQPCFEAGIWELPFLTPTHPTHPPTHTYTPTHSTIGIIALTQPKGIQCLLPLMCWLWDGMNGLLTASQWPKWAPNCITVAQMGSNTLARRHTNIHAVSRSNTFVATRQDAAYTKVTRCLQCMRAWSEGSDLVPNSCGRPHLHNLLLNALSNAGRSAHCHELCVSNTQQDISSREFVWLTHYSLQYNNNVSVLPPIIDLHKICCVLCTHIRWILP